MQRGKYGSDMSVPSLNHTINHNADATSSALVVDEDQRLNHSFRSDAQYYSAPLPGEDGVAFPSSMIPLGHDHQSDHDSSGQAALGDAPPRSSGSDTTLSASSSSDACTTCGYVDPNEPSPWGSLFSRYQCQNPNPPSPAGRLTQGSGSPLIDEASIPAHIELSAASAQDSIRNEAPPSQICVGNADSRLRCRSCGTHQPSSWFIRRVAFKGKRKTLHCLPCRLYDQIRKEARNRDGHHTNILELLEDKLLKLRSDTDKDGKPMTDTLRDDDLQNIHSIVLSKCIASGSASIVAIGPGAHRLEDSASSSNDSEGNSCPNSEAGSPAFANDEPHALESPSIAPRKAVQDILKSLEHTFTNARDMADDRMFEAKHWQDILNLTAVVINVLKREKALSTNQLQSNSDESTTIEIHTTIEILKDLSAWVEDVEEPTLVRYLVDGELPVKIFLDDISQRYDLVWKYQQLRKMSRTLRARLSAVRGCAA